MKAELVEYAVGPPRKRRQKFELNSPALELHSIIQRPPAWRIDVTCTAEQPQYFQNAVLPAQIRRQYGLRWDPVRGLATRAGAEYAKRLVLPVLPGQLRYRSAA